MIGHIEKQTAYSGIRAGCFFASDCSRRNSFGAGPLPTAIMMPCTSRLALRNRRDDEPAYIGSSQAAIHPNHIIRAWVQLD